MLLPGAHFYTQDDKDCPIGPDEAFKTIHAAYYLCGFEFSFQDHDYTIGFKIAKTLFSVERAFCEVLKAKRPQTRGELLQIVGTEIGRRRIDPDLWMILAEDRILELKANKTPWILTDVRYENELEMVRRRGGVVLRIEAPELTPGKRDHQHPSETSLDHVHLPTVVNDRTQERDAALNEMCSNGIKHAIERISLLEVRTSKFYNKQTKD